MDFKGISLIFENTLEIKSSWEGKAIYAKKKLISA